MLRQESLNGLFLGDPAESLATAAFQEMPCLAGINDSQVRAAENLPLWDSRSLIQKNDSSGSGS